MCRAEESANMPHMNKTILRAIAGVFVLGFLSPSASGQAQTTGVSLQAELLKDWIGLKETMHKIAAEMPADKYSFKATPAQQTFGERTVHVATTNVYFLGLLGGTALRRRGTRVQPGGIGVQAEAELALALLDERGETVGEGRPAHPARASAWVAARRRALRVSPSPGT
jgi:hypothetical protein